jgi:hypothetical protein
MITWLGAVVDAGFDDEIDFVVSGILVVGRNLNVTVNCFAAKLDQLCNINLRVILSDL